MARAVAGMTSIGKRRRKGDSTFEPHLENRFQPRVISHHSKLETQQIQHHLPASHPARIPQRRQVKRAREPISQAERNHGRNPAARIL